MTEKVQFNVWVRSDWLLTFKRTALPDGYGEVVEVLLHLFVEDKSLRSRVQQKLRPMEAKE